MEDEAAHVHWLTALLFALAVFRAYAYLRHRELADLLAASGLALLACAEYRRVISDMPVWPDRWCAAVYVVGMILFLVAITMMLVRGG